MAPFLRGEAGVLHVVASAAQPRVSAGCDDQSKSQKRRSRMRQCAIWRSKVLSCQLSSQLGCGVDTWSLSERQRDMGPSMLEYRLEVIEHKLDALILSYSPPGLSHNEFNLDPTCFGISSEILSRQCAAAQAIQDWWIRS